MRFSVPLMTAVLGLGLLAACRDAKVKHYRVEREPEPALPGGAEAMSGGAAPAGGGAMAGTPVATAQGSQLTWTVPGDWKDKPGSAMRKGSYAVPGPGGEADLAITAFPGDVGGDLANVNRWRGQLALPPIEAGELEAALFGEWTAVRGRGSRAAGRRKIAPHARRDRAA